jgi:hypothetical protein
MNDYRLERERFALTALACVPAILLLLGQSGPSYAAGAQLFEQIPESTISDQTALDRLRFVKTRHLLMYETLLVDPRLLESNQVSIVLPGGNPIEFDRNHSERRGLSDYSWSGRSTIGYGEAVFTVLGQRVLGNVRMVGKDGEFHFYTIQPLSDEFHVLFEDDPTKIPRPD